ncbi:hypothetical protein NPIL_472881 [Nephila pilipes]|uniref:Uncharacterized protein n=1 Tax=Nephila pilipes TaxID=299642 RepID=A0A8X6QZF5_NEPPI|nr:hypothetical protein NPIL_472881 [Nephila pilipes]
MSRCCCHMVAAIWSGRLERLIRRMTEPVYYVCGYGGGADQEEENNWSELENPSGHTILNIKHHTEAKAELRAKSEERVALAILSRGAGAGAAAAAGVIR